MGKFNRYPSDQDSDETARRGKIRRRDQFLYETQYFASDEKITLSIDIAKRERALLNRIDYENGYSLYIGIPFCPTTCLYCSLPHIRL